MKRSVRNLYRVNRRESQAEFRNLRTLRDEGKRYPVPVYIDHELRAFALLGEANFCSPFLAGAKVPSRYVISQSIFSSFSNIRNNSFHIFFHTPFFCHALSRRQQVMAGPYLVGSSFHWAPVRSIQRIPSITFRSSARGLPPLEKSCRGSSGSMTRH